MNNAGAMNSRLIVILNDNDMSIAPPVGAMSAYLPACVSGRTYRSLREIAQADRQPPAASARAARQAAEEYARGLVTGGTLFEELGFYYVGPIDGHNIDHLLPVLKNVRDARERAGPGPRRDAEGQGLCAGRRSPPTSITASSSSTSRPARRSNPSRRARLHQGLRRKPDQGSRARTTRSSPSPRRCRRAPASTCSQKEFPERTFDVGIAEQHARDLRRRAGDRGLQAVRAIYSTFLQRAYDQVVHDVAIQQLPVRFAMDRAGLVGADGPTHAGSFDIAYLGCLPGFRADGGRPTRPNWCTWWRPRSRSTIGPSALRYPRGEGRRRADAGAKASRSRSARAASCAKAPRSRCSPTARGSANA